MTVKSHNATTDAKSHHVTTAAKGHNATTEATIAAKGHNVTTGAKNHNATMAAESHNTTAAVKSHNVTTAAATAAATAATTAAKSQNVTTEAKNYNTTTAAKSRVWHTRGTYYSLDKPGRLRRCQVGIQSGQALCLGMTHSLSWCCVGRGRLIGCGSIWTRLGLRFVFDRRPAGLLGTIGPRVCGY